MKKKLKDITFEEFSKTCREQSKCSHCPFCEYCGWSISSMNNIEADLEKEIEL